MKLSHIAFVSSCPSVWWPGCEDLWSQTAIQCLKNGHKVTINVVGRDNIPEPVVKIKELGGRVIMRRKDLSSIIDKTMRVLGHESSSKARWLKSIAPDLVVISEGAEFEACDWSRACIINNMKYVIVTQSSSEWVWPDDRNIASVRDHYIKARACYFVSGENLKNIEMKTGVKLTNAKIVRNPFRVDYDSDLSWPVNDKVLRLACVAAAEPSRKGQDVLLQVLSQNKWRERPVLCDFFDYGGSCHGLLKNISDLFRLGNTRFIESITNVRDIWETHHALILPSRREGLPLALVEAMLCGRLCIVTNVGGSAEIMEDNITGFIAQMPTPAALDEAMERAWQRRSEWETMGRFAAQKIREIIPSEPDVAFLNELKLIL